MGLAYVTIAEQVESGISEGLLSTLGNVSACLWRDLAILAELRERGILSPEAWRNAATQAIEPAIAWQVGREDAPRLELRARDAAHRRAERYTAVKG
jgi:hypothetical protein